MEEMLFHQAYEDFYTMARTSRAFASYCQAAFGADLSQDGFSDVAQLERIFRHVAPRPDLHLLDVGCGNGKMLAWLQARLGGSIHGFDYAESAIRDAQALHEGDFRVGIIGQVDYPAEQFDLITCMDTLYFAPDMAAFVGQMKAWLRPGGVLFCGYQEGDVQPRTENLHTTVLAKALTAHGYTWQAEDITAETYALLRRKRACALAHRDDFAAENNQAWFDLLLAQTECALVPYASFRQQMARYLFVARKG